MEASLTMKAWLPYTWKDKKTWIYRNSQITSTRKLAFSLVWHDGHKDSSQSKNFHLKFGWQEKGVSWLWINAQLICWLANDIHNHHMTKLSCSVIEKAWAAIFKVSYSQWPRSSLIPRQLKTKRKWGFQREKPYDENSYLYVSPEATDSVWSQKPRHLWGRRFRHVNKRSSIFTTDQCILPVRRHY